MTCNQLSEKNAGDFSPSALMIFPALFHQLRLTHILLVKNKLYSSNPSNIFFKSYPLDHH
jgi:hypothetical protein